jgi:hypothetical protein
MFMIKEKITPGVRIRGLIAPFTEKGFHFFRRQLLAGVLHHLLFLP